MQRVLDLCAKLIEWDVEGCQGVNSRSKAGLAEEMQRRTERQRFSAATVVAAATVIGKPELDVSALSKWAAATASTEPGVLH